MKTVLIADEDSKSINLVRLIFTEYMGYRIVAASSGTDAVFKAREIKPDIVLADVSLSDKDGYEVSREIKNDPLLKDTPILLLLAQEFDEKKIAEAYADDFVIKPFEPREIIKKLEFLTVPKKEQAHFFVSQNREEKKSSSNIITLFLISIFMLAASILYIALGFGPPETELKTDDEIKKKEIISEIKEAGIKEPRFMGESISSSKLRYKDGEEAFRKEVVETSQPGGRETPEALKKVELEKEFPESKGTSKENSNVDKYFVRKGDTLWSIANRFNTSVKDLKDVNRLEDDKLNIGDVLVIPLGVKEEGPKEKDEEQGKMETKEEAKNTDTVTTSVTQPDGKYTVQIGVFQTGEKARKIVERLASKGYPAFIRTVKTPQKGSSHMIRVGKFKTEEEAKLYGDNLNDREPLVEKTIVVSETEGERKRQISQKPEPADLSKTTIQEKNKKKESNYEEVRDRVLGEIEEKVSKEEFSQSVLIPDIEEESIDDIRFKLWNSNRSILGPEGK